MKGERRHTDWLNMAAGFGMNCLVRTNRSGDIAGNVISICIYIECENHEGGL